MHSVAKLAAAAIAVAVVGSANSALADFSACDAALRSNDTQEQIKLYTLCITKGGLPIADRAGAYNNRGLAHARLGETDMAVQDFTSAIESDPNWATSYVNRGDFFLSRGDWTKAVADFDRAILVGPLRISIRAYRQEVWLLSTARDPAVRDGPKALRLAQTAVRHMDSPMMRDALAAAYAETGQFDDAVREETKAITMAQSKRPAEDIAEFQARLELYRKGAPFRN